MHGCVHVVGPNGESRQVHQVLLQRFLDREKAAGRQWRKVAAGGEFSRGGSPPAPTPAQHNALTVLQEVAIKEAATIAVRSAIFERSAAGFHPQTIADALGADEPQLPSMAKVASGAPAGLRTPLEAAARKEAVNAAAYALGQRGIPWPDVERLVADL